MDSRSDTTQFFRGDSDPLLGRILGVYRLESRVGSGGMGEVYRAHDTKLDRPVAIKLLAPDFVGDQERLRRFLAEARAASSLNHPHIIVIHDFGELDGRPFMVTELIDGETLRQRLEAGPMALPTAIDVVLQTATALDAAHTGGIIHRDVKPENVMIRRDGYVKVLDFGIAKLTTEQRGDGDNLVTLPGMVMGTPRYMSPEQVRGHQLDARSDIWSLGVILYEAVAGRAPFAGATSADLLGAVLNTEPVPLELQAPSAPPALGRVIARALRKERRERYASAAELAADLRAIKHQLESNDPTTHRMTASSALPAASPTPGSRAVRRMRIIVLPFHLLRPDTEIDFLSFSLADAMATTLSGLDSVIVRSSMTAAKLAREHADVEQIAREAEVDAVMTGTLLRVGEQIRVTAQVVAGNEGSILWSDRLDVSVTDVFKLQDDLSRRAMDALAVPLTVRDQEILQRDVPANPRAYELYLRANNLFYEADRWTVARDLLIECVQEDANYAPAWARLGRCYRLTAKFQSTSVEDMQEHLRRADRAFAKAFELSPDLPLAHNLFTALETDLGRSEDAVRRLLRRARQRPNDAELYAGLVHACRYCGLLDASLAAHTKARQLDPQIATSVAHTFWTRGEYERAIDHFGLTGFFVGLPYLSLGRYDDAIKAARAAAAVHDPTTRQYHSILPLMIEGRAGECLGVLNELAPRNPDPESVYHVARTYARLGDTTHAVAYFAKAVSMGYFCYPAFLRDEWLDPLRGAPAFEDAVMRAKRRHDEAARQFSDAGGERVLGL